VKLFELLQTDRASAFVPQTGGVVDLWNIPLIEFDHLALVVALCHTVWASTRRPRDCCRIWPYRNMPLPTCVSMPNLVTQTASKRMQIGLNVCIRHCFILGEFPPKCRVPQRPAVKTITFDFPTVNLVLYTKTSYQMHNNW